jgi:hypothetical protein
MDDLLKMEKLASGCPVMVANIPQQIQKEIASWVQESRKFKDHPLAELKAHENVGYLDSDGKRHNTYQCSISPRLVEESFWLAWVLRLSAKYWGAGKEHRQFRLRKWEGHFDGYDIWTNFAYRGNDNPSHNHSGILSGVIYYKNDNNPTVFDEYGCSYEGKDGTMVLFPSTTAHHVRPQISNKERITLAFNIGNATPRVKHD